MKKLFGKRLLAAAMSAVLLCNVAALGVAAANAQETPGLQLQTILVDNGGTNSWTTLSWGGTNLTPNTSWSAVSIRDYYANGSLNFEVRSNGTGECSFRVGLVSKRHNDVVRICWNDLDSAPSFTAGTGWKSYSLPIKELVDANDDAGFSLEDLWYIYVGGVPSGTTLSFQNVTISSTDDERQYPFIKVNQAGYEADAVKTARVSYFSKFGSLDGKTYEIINAGTGEIALSGTLSPAQQEDVLSGESVHVIQFDELTTPGTYYIHIPDAGLNAAVRSPRDVEENLDTDTIDSVHFTIQCNAYANLLSDLSKYYYYQRHGIDLEEKYAGDFARENLHSDDITVKKWSDRDNSNAETFDISGGWYDAGDYGKYTSTAASAVEDLLLAYEFYPEVFSEMQLNIPETDPGNARYVDAPGILSEAKWELDMLLKLEHSDKDGSFYVAANYKDGVIYLEDTKYSTSDYQSPSDEIDLRSHQATASAAAVLAHAYLVYREIPAYADFAQECLDTAIRAWNWVTDSANPKNMSIGAANRTYTFKQEELDREMFWAAGSLYRAVKASGGDAAGYEQYLVANCENTSNTNCFSSNSVSYNHAGRSFLGYFSYLYGNDAPDSAMTAVFAQFQTWRTKMFQYNNWGLAYPNWGYWWGSNRNVALSTMSLLLGSIITDGEDAVPQQVQDSMQNAFDYLLGVNPISFSYVSGYGENSVSNIFSAIYSKDAKLEPYRCPNGYFTEGTNPSNNRSLSKFNGKCYMDSDAEWTTNENTIYGNSAMIFLTAAIMSKNDQTVEGDVNADGVFDLSDLVMLQKWLLGDGTLTNWNAGDLQKDGSLNGYDLCIMRNRLAEE